MKLTLSELVVHSFVPVSNEKQRHLRGGETISACNPVGCQLTTDCAPEATRCMCAK